MTEDKIQQEIVNWYTNNYCLKHHEPRNLIFSIPNGGSRHIPEAMKLKATGLLAGASDLVLIHNGNLYFIELKDEKGKQQAAQKEFEERVKCHGFEYFIFRNLVEFQKFVVSL